MAKKMIKGDKEVVEKKSVKTEEKPIKVKEEPKKITAKPEAKKLTTKPEAKKLTTKENKKLTLKEEVKEEVIVNVEKPVKADRKVKEKAVKKVAKAEEKVVKEKKPRVKKDKVEVVVDLPFSAEEGITKMHGYNVFYTFDEYHRILLENETVDKAINYIKDACHLENFDDSILAVLFADLIARVDMTRKKFIEMGDTLREIMTRKAETLEEESQLYHDTFFQAGKILEFGERFKFTNLEELSAWTMIDLKKYFNFYMDVALKALRVWEDKDLENYEDFMSEVISQFDDCDNLFDFRFQIDVADLQIAHHFYAKGDSTFEYMLRENEIKDYIYYRYANAYVESNLDKAKWIANRAFTCVDERYVYFPKLIEIVNK